MKKIWLLFAATVSFLAAECIECASSQKVPVCGCSQHVQSDTMLTEAMEALERGAFDEALAGFKMLAKQGNFIAQQNLAVMYQNGFGIAKNPNLAAYWFQKADENFRQKSSMQRETLCPDGLRGRNKEMGFICHNSY